ncbi:hypothetical protein ACRQ5I_01365 [Pseudoramibacter alactolyticus]|nr:hypothetical protein [Pseudoramibacter alactolyticus]
MDFGRRAACRSAASGQPPEEGSEGLTTICAGGSEGMKPEGCPVWLRSQMSDDVWQGPFLSDRRTPESRL